MYMIEIDESKVDKMSELAEKMLKYGGKLMSCIEELSEESGMGERGSYGNRGPGGGSMGNRYIERDGAGGNRGGYGQRDDDEDDEEERMGERRGVKGTGRYSRFRR
jgi:hypothetical protein